MDEIPKAVFVENIEKYFQINYKNDLGKDGEITKNCAYKALTKFDEMVNKYRLVKVSSAEKVRYILNILLNE
jgi:ATP-dependent helicase/DNAse subunit B